jgi:hypothetical protein
MCDFKTKKALADAISECRHIKHSDLREIFLQYLDKEASSLVGSPIGTFLGLASESKVVVISFKLVDTILSYPSLYSIYIAVGFSLEGYSDQMRLLERMMISIFEADPNPSFLKKDPNKWDIYVDESYYISIPVNIDFELSSDHYIEAAKYQLMWKEIHTICDNFLSSYLPISNKIIAGNIEDIKKQPESFINICIELRNNLIRLYNQYNYQPQENLSPLCYLTKIEHCSRAIVHTLCEKKHSPYFSLGQEFTAHVLEMVLNSLKIADRIIDRIMKNSVLPESQ